MSIKCNHGALPIALCWRPVASLIIGPLTRCKGIKRNRNRLTRPPSCASVVNNNLLSNFVLTLQLIYETISIGYILFSIDAKKSIGRNRLTKMRELRSLFIILQKARRIISHRKGKKLLFVACSLSQ